MTESGSNSEGEVKPETIFETLGERLGKKIISMQLTDFDGTNLLLNAKGKCSKNIEVAEDLSSESLFKDPEDPHSLKAITYDDMKYILIKRDMDSGLCYLLYHSVASAESKEARRGMFLSVIGELHLIVTCAHNQLQAVNQEVISSLLEMIAFDE
jgi:hypothetical protein